MFMRNSFSSSSLQAGVIWGAVALAIICVVMLQAAFASPTSAHASRLSAAEIDVSLSQHAIPAVPNTAEISGGIGGDVSPTAAVPSAKKVGSLVPIEVEIPAAGIDKQVIGVGINKKGEMDVPSGESDYIGWYKLGVKPGQKGTAVMDAHVYAALKNLKHVEVGDDVYVSGEGGTQLHFRVTKTAVYKLSSLTPATLFTGVGSSGRYLNFITCAGTFSTKAATYSHRLIVFAELVD